MVKSRREIFVGNTEEARRLLEDLLAKKDNHVQALCYRGKLEPHPARAEQWYKKALAINANYLDAHFGLVGALRNQPNRKQEAELERQRYNDLEKEMQALPKILPEADMTANSELF